MIIDQSDIIIINWNGKHLLTDCLKSVQNQSYEHTNIVLVDNGSTDGSVEYVSQEFRNVKVVRLEDNRGFTGANNIGIKSGAGEFVALLNNDAVAHRHWLMESIRCLRRHPDAGFCASRIVNFFQRNLLDAAGDVYTRGGVNAKRGFGHTTDSHQDTGYVFGACAAAVVYRRDMLEEIGFFDEDFFIMCEDVDLSFRAQLAGYKCIYCPTAIVYHKTHGSIGGINKIFSYYGQRNLEYVFFKNLPFRLLVYHLPAHILYNIAVLLHFTVNGQLLSFLKAKFDFLLDLPDVLKKRALIQKKAKISTRDVDLLITGGWLLDKIKKKLLPVM